MSFWHFSLLQPPPFYLGKDWFFSLDLLILLSVHLVRCRSAPLGGFRRVSCVPADTRRIAARGYPCPRQRVSGLIQRPWTPVHPVMAAPLGNHDAGASLCEVVAGS